MYHRSHIDSRSLFKFTIIASILAFMLFLTIDPTWAAGPSDSPPWLSKKTIDTKQMDDGIKAGIDWALYIALGLGLLGVAVGFVMSVPIFGERKKGIEIIKYSLLVCAGSTFFWFIIGVALEVFGKK